MAKQIQNVLDSSWKYLGAAAFASAALLPTVYQVALLTH